MRLGLVGSLFCTLALGSIGTAEADELIGVETVAEDADDATDDEPAAQPKPAAKGKNSTASVLANRGAAPEAGDLTFSASLGATSKGSFGGSATVGYAVNRYVGVDGSYAYQQIETGDDSGVRYGPAADVVLRWPNPTLVTPFVGTGLGFVKWQRRYQNVVFDAGSAATGSAFAGASLNLTRHFGLQIERRQSAYLQTPPKRFDDRVSREPYTRVATNVGFYMKF